MQKYKISFKGQNIYVGIDVHLKTWHVTTLTETGCKYSFAQHSDAKELFDRLNRKFPDAHFKSAYEAGFCGFSAHYALTEQGFENIVVNAADIPTTGKERTMKSDAVDSEKIAWALKRGQLTGIYVKDKSFMDDANLMRLRQRFIKDLSRQKNRLKHLLYTQGVTYPERFAKSGTHWSRNFMKWLREEVVLLSEEKLTLMLLCDQVDNTRDAVLRVTREIRRLSQSDKYKENYDLLTTIPGVADRAGQQSDALPQRAKVCVLPRTYSHLPRLRREESQRRKDLQRQQAPWSADCGGKLDSHTERLRSGSVPHQLLSAHEASESHYQGGKASGQQGICRNEDKESLCASIKE